MEIIFINTKNSKTNEAHRLKLHLADTIDLKCTNKNITLLNPSIYCTWKITKNVHMNDHYFSKS